MKILFDGNVPRKLASHFPPGFQVTRAQSMGWAEERNGELLRLASQASFAALVTLDKRMQHEQNRQALPLPVFVLSAPQQKDLEYLGRLVSSEVAPLLEQGAENRFHFLGPGHERTSPRRPPHDSNFIHEPPAVAYGRMAVPPPQPEAQWERAGYDSANAGSHAQRLRRGAR